MLGGVKTFKEGRGTGRCVGGSLEERWGASNSLRRREVVKEAERRKGVVMLKSLRLGKWASKMLGEGSSLVKLFVTMMKRMGGCGDKKGGYE